MSHIITPNWVKHAVFYQIFPDRFAMSNRVHKPSNLEAWNAKPTTHGFKGGDLLGVVEKLDYLKDLGITAIYFCPIFQSTANHRYHTQDYFNVDPILGGNEAFKELLRAAHKHNMRIVIDGVFNHASRGFYQFNHALENGAHSPYLDWFNFHGFPVHAYHGALNYDCWWNIPSLPKLNTKTLAVREFIWRVAEHWIAQGVDGWRLDVPAEINDDNFWREFRRRVKHKNPDAYIVGEIWHEATRWLQGDQFDAVMNYLFTNAVLGFFAQKLDTHLIDGIGYAPVSKLDAPQFAFKLNHMMNLYDKAICDVQMNLLDSHDTARFLSIVKEDETALELSWLALMTFPGAPCVYYGDEIGMLGGKDPDCRRAFDWNEETWDTKLRDNLKKMIALRKQHRALRDGGFRVLYAEKMTVAYLREHGNEKLIVVLNAGQELARVEIHTNDALPNSAVFKSVFGRRATATTKNGLLSVKIGAREGLILEMQ
jgi:neopullulanase